MHKEKKVIFLGALIGGVVGLMGASFLCSKTKRTKESHILRHLGDLLDESSARGEEIVGKAEEGLEKNEESLATLMQWVAAGLQVWNKLKKKI